VFWLKKLVSFWLMPLPLCLLLLACGCALMRLPRRATLGRLMALAGAVLLALLSNKLVSTRLLRPLEDQFPAIPEIAPGGAAPAACQKGTLVNDTTTASKATAGAIGRWLREVAAEGLVGG